MSKLLIGIDLGGTNVKIGCFNRDLTLLHNTSVKTDADMGPDDVIDRIVDAATALILQQGYTLNDLAGAGIGTPGPADYHAGLIIRSTNMPTFQNVPIRQMLENRLNCTVAFDNDANVACYGEFTVGAGKDVDDMVFFTLGTGIGCGIVAHGRLIRGAGGNAAEVGHMIIYPDGERCNCGQRGCVEAYASASHTARRATEAIQAGVQSRLKTLLDDKGHITAEDVYNHLAIEDALAQKITDDTAKALALMCINMLHTTDPSRIVFAGGMIAAGDVLLNRIQAYFAEQIWTLKKETVQIVFASLGEDAGIIGAAALARDALESS